MWTVTGTNNGTEPLLMLLLTPVFSCFLTSQNVCCEKSPIEVEEKYITFGQRQKKKVHILGVKTVV